MNDLRKELQGRGRAAVRRDRREKGGGATLRTVLHAGGLAAAAKALLDTFAERWDKKYPKISLSWRENWPNLSTYFKYPQELRRLIYTANAIEGFNRQLRKVTKAKSVFPTDDSLFKMLYWRCCHAQGAASI